MITAKKSKYRLSPSKIVFIIVMLAVPLANFAIFTVYANLGGLVLSFKQIRDGKEVFVFFENFQRFFRLFELRQNNRHVVRMAARRFVRDVSHNRFYVLLSV